VREREFTVTDRGLLLCDSRKRSTSFKRGKEERKEVGRERERERERERTVTDFDEERLELKRGLNRLLESS